MPMAMNTCTNLPQTMVRPVGTHGVPTPIVNPIPHAMFPNPLQGILAAGLEVPTFLGTREDFKRYERALENFMKAAENCAGFPLNDAQKLMLLERTLVPITKKVLQNQRGNGKAMSYVMFWAQLQNEVDSSNTNMDRAAWENIACHNPGNVTFEDWRKFEIEFCMAWHDVPDATGEEAYKMLLPKIPHSLRPDLMEKDGKLASKKPRVCISNIGDFDTQRIRQMIARWTGYTPLEVEKLGPEKYILHVENSEKATLCLSFDKRVTQNSQRVIEVKIMPSHLTVEEAMAYVSQKNQIPGPSKCMDEAKSAIW